MGWSQEKELQWHLLGEAAVPVFQELRGWGGYLKASYLTGGTGAVNVTTGLSRFRFRNIDEKGTVLRLVPLLIGYEWRFGSFYLLSQAGIGELGGKKDIGGDHARISVAAFFWTAGAGFERNRAIAGLRFQRVTGIEGPDAGLWHNRSFHYTAAFVGYRLSC